MIAANILLFVASALFVLSPKLFAGVLTRQIKKHGLFWRPLGYAPGDMGDQWIVWGWRCRAGGITVKAIRGFTMERPVYSLYVWCDPLEDYRARGLTVEAQRALEEAIYDWVPSHRRNVERLIRKIHGMNPNHQAEECTICNAARRLYKIDTEA